MRINLLTLYLIFFSISSLFAQPKDSSCYCSLNCDDFYLLNKTEEVLIIDVRQLKEFTRGRIEGAYLAANRKDLEILLENENREVTIVVYCDEGKRSKGAAEIICSELKFTTVYNLEGGIRRWEKEDYPIVKD